MGAAGYEYAIGSAPGATDMSTWSNNGVASVFARGGLSLSVGQTYDASAPEVAGAQAESAVEPAAADAAPEDTAPVADA